MKYNAWSRETRDSTNIEAPQPWNRFVDMILTRLVENNLTQFCHIAHVLSDILDRRNNSRLFACVSKSEKVSEADAGITLLAPRRPDQADNCLLIMWRVPMWECLTQDSSQFAASVPPINTGYTQLELSATDIFVTLSFALSLISGHGWYNGRIVSCWAYEVISLKSLLQATPCPRPCRCS